MNRAEEILKENNLSVTQARKAVLSIFLDNKKPVTVKEIKRGRNCQDINESSIYRNLTKLEEKGIIQAIPGASDYQSFELTPKDHHHHHISCVKCKTIECLDLCSLEKGMKAMADSVGFSLTGHSLELMGFCKTCRA